MGSHVSEDMLFHFGPKEQGDDGHQHQILVDFQKKTSILESILQLVLEGKKAPNFGWSQKKKISIVESMLQLLLKEKY